MEIKEINQIIKNQTIWNKQEEKDIFNEPIDWSSTYYRVILKDGFEYRLCAFLDESSDGSIHSHFEFIDNDDCVDFDEILLWKHV